MTDGPSKQPFWKQKSLLMVFLEHQQVATMLPLPLLPVRLRLVSSKKYEKKICPSFDPRRRFFFFACITRRRLMVPTTNSDLRLTNVAVTHTHAHTTVTIDTRTHAHHLYTHTQTHLQTRGLKSSSTLPKNT